MPHLAWPLRFLVWGTPLTWLAVTFYEEYVWLLTQVVSRIFAARGIRVEFSLTDIVVPMDLALYGALALASVRTPWKGRLGRLAMGWSVLVVIQVVAVVAGVTIFLKPGASTDAGRVFVAKLIGLIGWVGATIVWMLLFGGREIPLFSGFRSSQQHQRRRMASRVSPRSAG